MYKLLHIHNNITFAWDSNKFLNEKFCNEIIFIGSSNKETIDKLSSLPIPYKIFDKKDIKVIVEYADKFDGIVFYNLDDIKVQILLRIKREIKTFLRFFGYELYGVCSEHFLSPSSWEFYAKPKKKFPGILKEIYHLCKRKVKLFLNIEYDIQMDNQKKVYSRLDAIMMINEFEYLELKKLFYLPKLIELQFTNHENEVLQSKFYYQKSNKIIVGNSGGRWNNHIDILNLINATGNKNKIEFSLFFSYGTEGAYSQKVKSMAQKIQNVDLVEEFLNKEKFEQVYTPCAALIINSYRQHAVGNIITAIQYGCKIYLNKKNSTYHWLLSKGFLISEVEELTKDIENGNIKLTAEQQQHNFDCFLLAIKNYTVRDFINKIDAVLKS